FEANPLSVFLGALAELAQRQGHVELSHTSAAAFFADTSLPNSRRSPKTSIRNGGSMSPTLTGMKPLALIRTLQVFATGDSSPSQPLETLLDTAFYAGLRIAFYASGGPGDGTFDDAERVGSGRRDTPARP